MARRVIGSELESNSLAPDKPKKKTWVKVIIGIVLLLVVVLGYFVYSDLKQEELLKTEIET